MRFQSPGGRVIYYLRFLLSFALASCVNAICVSNRPVNHRPVTKQTGVNFNGGGSIDEPHESDMRVLCRRRKFQLTGRLRSGR